jgi:predicted RNase H-like HicB family nuclease
MVRVDVTVEVLIKTKYDQKEGFWFATSPFLDIVQHGKTEKQALERFKSAFEILLISSIRKGTILSIFNRFKYGIRLAEIEPGHQVILLSLPDRSFKSEQMNPFHKIHTWNKQIEETSQNTPCLV